MRGEETYSYQDIPPILPPTHLPSCPTDCLPPIKGFLETSFVDWPGKLCAMIFVGGCNFRCPFCHNHPLVLTPKEMDSISFAEIQTRLTTRRKWLDGVCISGGEPTISPGLPAMIARLKAEGWAIKLDTNGSRPEVLAGLLKEGLLDMVAMDVKAPLVQKKYEACTGCQVELDKIRQSIELLKNSKIDHQFRITVLPRLHSEDDIRAWVEQLAGENSRLKIQNFNPRTTMDSLYEKESGFAPEIFSRLADMAATG
ncbi:MAG: anaerobic ribonucleoside-triphosphate reductase activating protein [Desulfobulbaceae bacterium]|nr:anaerobic ribonucleoside-triphosphate reductase activating protein [Desulfobulbaceae bacterium]HIJ79017.1 anaerobic ribonucleoside-triphosphate reductase activating protein [Deltaproteobacteria bacterium]